MKGYLEEILVEVENEVRVRSLSWECDSLES
jgi:hypothetical protein